MYERMDRSVIEIQYQKLADLISACVVNDPTERQGSGFTIAQLVRGMRSYYDRSGIIQATSCKV